MAGLLLVYYLVTRGIGRLKSWPQKRHFLASSKTISAQSGHFLWAGVASGGAGEVAMTGGAGCTTFASLLMAHTKATTHPTSVHPKKKFKAPMAPAFCFLFCLATM